MKKLFAVLLALALVLSMGIMAFAADTGTITITNAVDGVTYKIYRMLDFTPSNAEGSQGIYTVNSAWTTFFSGSDPSVLAVFDVTENNGKKVVTLKEGATIDQAIAKNAISFAQAENNELTPTKSAKADDSGVVEFTGLPLGYYVIDTSLGSMCILTNTNSTAEVVEKNEKPDLVKKIVEGTKLVDANSANIGDTITYQATITVGTGAQNYVMHDKMSAGLEYTGVTSVTVNGNPVDAANYTVVEDPADDCTFDIEFEDSYTSTLAKGTEIVVTYTAELTAAVVGAEGNPNEAWLSYGDDQKSTHDFVITYTTKLTVEKVDADSKPLAGAGFTLYKNVDGTWTEVGTEKVITSLADGEEAIYEWNGLEEGTYKLVETTVPAGYNKADNIEFTIKCDKPDVKAGTETADWTVTVDENKVTENNDTFEATIVNKTGSLLPETGGIGTTIFYVVGGLLMVAAVVILVSKKRMKGFA